MVMSAEAGITAAVDHLAGLDPHAIGTRRERVLTSMTAVAAYEEKEGNAEDVDRLLMAISEVA